MVKIICRADGFSSASRVSRLTSATSWNFDSTSLLILLTCLTTHDAGGGLYFLIQ